MEKNKVLFFLVIVVVILVFHSYSTTPKYNVILISEDTLRADHVGIYENGNVTPNIDRLAKEGVYFENAIVNYDWTLPSHVSMLSSLYASTHSVVLVEQKINDNVLTIQEILKKKGYYTFAYTGDVFISKKYGFDQGFDFFDDYQGEYFSDFYDKLSVHLEQVKSKKFFLFIHSYDTHIDNLGAEKINHSQLKLIEQTYDKKLSEYDSYIGNLYEKLEELELLDNTLIIFTSDHGEEFLEHGKIGHGRTDPYEEIIKVPLIIRLPDKIKNKRIQAQVQSIDIPPTILDILGYSIPISFQGKSIMPLIEDKKENLHDYIFTETRGKNAIRTQNEKYILRDNFSESYNLSTDPHEKINIGILPEEIIQAYDKFKLENTKLRDKLNIEPIYIKNDEELLQKLTSLGYIS